jgi:hypothetical protein
MSGVKLELDNTLWAKAKDHALGAGYSSPDEFVQHLIERELSKLEAAGDDEERARKLKGIGYLDAGLDI